MRIYMLKATQLKTTKALRELLKLEKSKTKTPLRNNGIWSLTPYKNPETLAIRKKTKWEFWEITWSGKIVA